MAIHSNKENSILLTLRNKLHRIIFALYDDVMYLLEDKVFNSAIWESFTKGIKKEAKYREDIFLFYLIDLVFTFVSQ